MPYRLTTYGRTRIALPGVPWRELNDEEYDAAVLRHPGMEEQGYFQWQPEEDEAVEEEPQAEEAEETTE